MSTHYHRLNIRPTATLAEIKAAYRKLVLLFHPDRGGDQQKFVQIADAFAILQDKQKRMEYDSSLSVNSLKASTTPSPTSATTTASQSQRSRFGRYNFKEWERMHYPGPEAQFSSSQTQTPLTKQQAYFDRLRSKNSGPSRALCMLASRLLFP